jgi:serralysin
MHELLFDEIEKKNSLHFQIDTCHIQPTGVVWSQGMETRRGLGASERALDARRSCCAATAQQRSEGLPMIQRLSNDAGFAPASAGGASSDLPFRLDDYAGLATFRDKPIYTLDQVVHQIDSGTGLPGGNNTFTYGFLDGPTTVGLYNNPNDGFSEPAGYTSFSEAQKAAAREAIQYWDDLVPQHFVEKTGAGVDILYANTTTGPAQAWTYYPGGGVKVQSDVWAATPDANWTNNWLNFNGYGLTTLVHETGHALGLSHPGDYNYGADNDGDGVPDPITYAGSAFYAQDSMQFSIMSYFDPRETGATPIDVWTGLLAEPQTPLLHDIYVIQSKYGADPTTRAGDTTYGFHSNAAESVYDFTQNHAPYLSIYDAGGNDTLDLSGANSGVFLDLRPGSFSSAAVAPTLEQANAATEQFNAATDDTQGDFALWTQDELDAYVAAVEHNRALQIESYTGVSGVNALSFQNISIAYDTIIENAVGGSARDYLVGNQVGNVLNGNGGDDVLDGLGGNDTLIGGAGADEFRFTTLGGTDRIADFQSGVDIINLSEIDANAGVAGDQAFSWAAAFNHAAGQAVLTWSAATTTLSLDVDGDGRSDLDVVINGHVTTAENWVL